MPIGFHCITSAKFEQKATLLRQGFASDHPVINRPDQGEEPVQGHYVMKQHPVTREFIRIWEPINIDTPADNTFTPEVETAPQVFTFDCQARGVLTGGLNSQGTTERWNSKGGYENVDFVELQVPRDVVITKRDRVTDISDSRGNMIWIEEEFGRMTPTVFDVRGVTPSVDPFGSVTEWFVLLERAQIQSESGRERGE